MYELAKVTKTYHNGRRAIAAVQDVSLVIGCPPSTTGPNRHAAARSTAGANRLYGTSIRSQPALWHIQPVRTWRGTRPLRARRGWWCWRG
jgi:hypothetical protein